MSEILTTNLDGESILDWGGMQQLQLIL
jgi:hypothetical protein